MKTKILEIINQADKQPFDYDVCREIAIREIESFIKKNYVEWNFVKWAIIEQEIFYGELSEQIILNDNPEKFYTLDEVYRYWQTNIKDKYFGSEFAILEVDSCEYIMISNDSRSLTHKGNCKYCKERLSKLLKQHITIEAMSSCLVNTVQLNNKRLQAIAYSLCYKTFLEMATDEQLIEIYDHYGASFFGKGDDKQLKEWGNSEEKIREIKIECVNFKLNWNKEGVEMYKLLNEKCGGKNVL